MVKQGGGGQVLGPWMLSDDELRSTITELEAEREVLEARCCVVRRRIALLRAERLARVRDTHFDPGPVAEALLQRLPGFPSVLERLPGSSGSLRSS